MSYYLSECLIIKNEASYLEEHLEHHLMQGVEHFYIYDNLSDDNISPILNRYVEAGFATVTQWPHVPGQMAAYADCLRRFGKDTKWLGFWDCDEFCYSSQGTLSEELRDYEDAPAVAIHWKLFGSDKHLVKTDDLVIERFTFRAKDINPHVKSIVQPEYTLGVGNDPHSFHLVGSAVDENHMPLPKEYAVKKYGTPTARKLAIAHYHTKSKQEAFERWKIPRADTGQLRNFEESFAAHDKNEVQDLDLAGFALVLKNRLKMRRGK